MKRGTDATEREMESLVGLFRLLSDQTRLTILMLLATGERNVSTLCQELDLPQPTVSHHLGLLRMQNLISNRRNGKQVFYELNSHVNATDGDALQINVSGYTLRLRPRENRLAN